MKVYDWKELWSIGSPETEAILTLRKVLEKEMNTGLSGTIPKLAKKLHTDEQIIAWALQNTCDCRQPRILVDSDEGEKYFNDVIKLSWKSPRPFTDKMEFYGRDMR